MISDQSQSIDKLVLVCVTVSCFQINFHMKSKFITDTIATQCPQQHSHTISILMNTLTSSYILCFDFVAHSSMIQGSPIDGETIPNSGKYGHWMCKLKLKMRCFLLLHAFIN